MRISLNETINSQNYVCCNNVDNSNLVVDLRESRLDTKLAKMCAGPSPSSKRLLEEENIEDCDIFCALTNDDEVNIMSSLLAKRLGAKKVLTLINNAAYVDLVQGGDIDIAISPQQATIGSLLTHVRRGDIVNVHSLRRGAAEAIEAIAHGDKQSSKVVGRTIREIDLPDGTTIGAIVRGKEVIIAHGDVRVESGDHIILFVIDKRRIRDVERLFQVGLTFF